MKLFFLLISFVFTWLPLISETTTEFLPFFFNIEGVEAFEETIVGYGDKGSVFVSNDNGSTWVQSKAFKDGLINGVSIEDNRIVAFKHDGEISISSDNGESWELKTNVLSNDSIIAILKSEDYYYLRTKNTLTKLNVDFTTASVIPLSFDKNKHNEFSYADYKSIIEFNGFLYTYSDSGIIYKLNKNIEIVDSLNIINLADCNNCTIKLLSSDDKLYFRLGSYLYTGNELNNLTPFLDITKYNTVAFDSATGYIHHIGLYNNKLITLNKYFKYRDGPFFEIYQITDSNNAVSLGSLDCSLYEPPPGRATRARFNDFTINNDVLTIVRDSNFIAQYNFDEKRTNRVSNLRLIKLYNYTHLISGSNDEVLLVSPRFIYKSYDSGMTFSWLYQDSIFWENSATNIRLTEYTDDKLYIVSSGKKMFISEDFGETFKEKNLDSLVIIDDGYFSNLNKFNNGFAFAGNYNSNWSGKQIYQTLYFYDDEFELIEAKKDSLYNINFIHAKNLDEYTILTTDTLFDFNNYSVKHTSDGGQNWETISYYGAYKHDSIKLETDEYRYLYTSRMRVNKQYSIDGTDYLLVAVNDEINSTFGLDIINLNTLEVDSSYRKTSDGYVFSEMTIYKDTVYLAANDTLFYFTSDNMYNPDEWDYHIFPDNGKVYRRGLHRLGDKFLVIYEDDEHPVGVYYLSFDSEITSVENTNSDIETYIYTDKPYPNPANGISKVDIYIPDNLKSRDLTYSIYDITGNKVEGGENVTLNINNGWPATLTWNTGNQTSGIYFIEIKVGTESKIVKVMVN